MTIVDIDRKNQMSAQDDIQALIAAAQNDPAAFGRLYDRYVQPIYRYVYSRVGSAHEAEDITSQTFMAAYEALARYRERGQFSAWLFRIARSKMNDHFRRNRREVPLEVAGEILEREDALGVLIRAEELSRIRFLVNHLNEEEQELIRLRYVAGLSFLEIADLLGKREDAVKKSVYRLLARLKSQME
ncbi:MAG TPA: sigma-70 family RNA polymerase sigma factor [Anaerolineales bacterium]|nr:sigma-70 family RNA polymerase sigma factor [Anaerolineales bacterium]